MPNLGIFEEDLIHVGKNFCAKIWEREYKCWITFKFLYDGLIHRNFREKVWAYLMLSLLRINLELNTLTSSHLNYNLCCNSSLARITKQNLVVQIYRFKL
jgi:hypothetical protein